MKTAPSLSEAFVQYISSANGISLPLQPDGWLRLAIRSSAGAGNPKKSVLKLSRESVIQIQSMVDNLTANLAKTTPSQAAFDLLFQDSIHEAMQIVALWSPATTFSFGRAQKILTIYLKYAYCHSWVYPMLCPPLVTLTEWRRYFQIPVDRQTLLFFHRRGSPSNVALLANRRLVSWKWNLDEVRYLEIQRQARLLASNLDYDDPLHFEMDRVWTQPSSGKHMICRARSRVTAGI